MQRLDKLLVDRGLASTRTQAQKLIDAGLVELSVAGQSIEGEWLVQSKSSVKLPIDSQLRVGEHPDMRYVSRAGLKLEAALQNNAIDVIGLTALDVGQSTGGFTDCLLACGAAKVVGIEVGHDQLVERLRSDDRVVCLEGVNARYLDVTVLQYAPQKYDIIVMDVSFISQKLILPNFPVLIKNGGLLISLVKPQFEVGPDWLGKGGIVRADADMNTLKDDVCGLIKKLGFTLVKYCESPIKGGDGNREYLLIARFNG